jgi:hypothetical protein
LYALRCASRLHQGLLAFSTTLQLALTSQVSEVTSISLNRCILYCAAQKMRYFVLPVSRVR